jgi:8-oxo-dGTP pyrophosphatase MutT (NUDIX family)
MIQTYFTVMAVVRNKGGKFLITQRAKERSNPGLWNHITGFAEEKKSAEDAALRELMEESNLEGKLIRSSEPFWRDFGEKRWIVVASLIEVEDISNLKLDELELQAYDWIDLEDKKISYSIGMKAGFKNLDLI